MEIFDNRKDMIKHYCDKMEELHILEIGVFQGDFLEYIEQNIKYDTIEGVDLFYGEVGSGDENGNNMIKCDMSTQFILLNSKYEDNKNVNLYKSHSNTYLAQQPNDKYNVIYIDADHSYDAVKRDIELAYEKIKNGGYIMGHDYELNKDKCFHNWQFGTKRAVDEFCEKYNQSIIAKGMDGCVSFCIQVRK